MDVLSGAPKAQSTLRRGLALGVLSRDIHFVGPVVWCLAMSINKCLYCGNSLGLRRFTGSSFCSDAHAQADADQMSAMMLRRLRVSAGHYRAAQHAQQKLEQQALAKRESERQEQVQLLLQKALAKIA